MVLSNYYFYTWVEKLNEDYLLLGAASTIAFEQFVNEVAIDDRVYDFFESYIAEIDIQQDQAFITMELSYSVADGLGEMNFFNKSKVYTVILDAYDNYQISNVIDS